MSKEIPRLRLCGVFFTHCSYRRIGTKPLTTHQVYRHLLFNRLGREDDRFDVNLPPLRARSQI